MKFIPLFICATAIAFANAESDSATVASGSNFPTESSFELLVKELNSTFNDQPALNTNYQKYESQEGNKIIDSEKGQIAKGTIKPNYKFVQDSRDGHIYRVTEIGGLTWMAEDLNFEGKFYTWAKAMDSLGIYSENGKNCGLGNLCHPTYPVRGICPEGWHLPDIAESEVLMNVKNSKSANTYTYSTSINRMKIPDSTDPAPEIFNFDAPYVYFWNSTERDEYYAYYPAIHFYGLYAGMRNFYKGSGLPVRCVMNAGEAPTNQ